MRTSLAIALLISGAGTMMNVMFYLNDLNPMLSLGAAGVCGGCFVVNVLNWINS